MKRAIVSGDIIASTSLNNADRSKIGDCLKLLTKKLNKKFKVYSRLTEGNDYIDSYIPNNSDALRVMLAIKCFVKSIPISTKDSINHGDNRSKFFKTHGIRLALGIGELSRLDIHNGIIDGEAIYFSGRTISENRTYNKEKVVIKNTLFIKSDDKEFDDEFTPLLALLDVLLSKCTSKQSTVLYLKLLGYDEATIARVLGKKQSTINEHSTSAGWIAIEKAVNRFEDVVKTKEL
jgi:hypothetical protein